MEWNGKFMWDSLGIDLIQSWNFPIFKRQTTYKVQRHVLSSVLRISGLVDRKNMFKTLQMSLNHSRYNAMKQAQLLPFYTLIWFSLIVLFLFFSVCGLIEKLSLSKMPFEDDPVISESIKPLYICSFKNLCCIFLFAWFLFFHLCNSYFIASNFLPWW